MKAIKTAGLAAALAATAATAMPMAATAHADEPGYNYAFVTPSGNVTCYMWADAAGASCDIRDHAWVKPASNDCGVDSGGPFLYLDQRSTPESGVTCYWTSSPADGNLPILDYGQTHTRFTFTCDSGMSGVTCTDNSTGHFFRISRESYQLG